MELELLEVIAVLWCVVSLVTTIVVVYHDFNFIIGGIYRFGDWGWLIGGTVFAPLMWTFFAVAWCFQELVQWFLNRDMKRRFGNGRIEGQ